MAHLCEELIVEILLRLTVKSLLRFRCLSKSLRAVIDSSHFIKSHLCKSSLNLNRRKLILNECEDPDDNDDENYKFHVCDLNLNPGEEIVPHSSFLGQVTGYCNGLLLFYIDEIGFSVYNPSTRHLRDLPRFPFEAKCIHSGFGYDESIDDYKVVVSLIGNHLVDYNYKPYELQVWVCELKSNIWRRVETSPSLLRGFGCFVNGHLHWICKTICGYESVVVSFDVSKEKFSIVPQPILFRSCPKLHVLEGCLCITYLDTRCMPHRADIYMMTKNDGVDAVTWTQIHSVENPSQNVDALEHSKGGDKILLDFGYCTDYIVSYDLKKKSFLKVEISNKGPTWTAPILCLESLVPVSGGA